MSYQSIPCPKCSGSGYTHKPFPARAMRHAVKLTLREVARRMKITAAYLSDLELGRRGWTEERVKQFKAVLK